MSTRRTVRGLEDGGGISRPAVLFVIGWLSMMATGCHCGATPHTGAADHTGDSTAVNPGPELPITIVEVDDAAVGTPTTLALVHVGFGDGPLVGDTLVSVPATVGDQALPLPSEVPDDHLAELSPQDAIGGALYMVVVFWDQDEDGVFSEGERMYGVAMDRWVLWLDTDCWECDTDQPVDSWQVVDLGIAGQYAPNRCALDASWPLEWMQDQGYPVYHDLDESISVVLRGGESDLELAGDVVDLSQDALQLAALPYPWLNHRDAESAFDQALAPDQDSFTANLSSEPPEEDDVGSDPDWRYTMHLVLPYTDVDGSGGWTLGDTVEGSSTCVGGELAWARYTRAVSTYRGFRFLDCYQGNVGWRLAHYDEEGSIEYLSSEQAQQLQMDFTSCRLD